MKPRIVVLLNTKTKYKRVCFLLINLFLLFQTTSICAQETINSNSETSEQWADMTLTKRLSEKWSFGGDFGLRTSFNNREFQQFYIRPRVNYRLTSRIDFSLGVGTFNTFRENLFNIYEFRIYQDANVKWPKLGMFNILHRIRFEERFFNYSTSTLNADFIWRARYMLGVRTDRFSMGGKENWSAFLSLEPFLRLVEDSNEFLANNFRWDTALSYQATEQLRVELHYILQTSELFNFVDTRVVEHIVRLRLFYRIKY